MNNTNLVFLCPITKRGIDSGFDSDNVSRIHMEEEAVRMRCPHCGNTHEFRMSDSIWAAQRTPRGR